MSLNQNQKQAVEYLEGPLLVLAGPGTGKTQLLSSKVEYILKNTDANPENILCLTYTESGAQNMRDRLFSMIGSAASKVHIHTYHAFGSTVLAEYKNYAESFDRNLDSAIDNITEYKIIKNIQGSLPAFDILKRANISDIIDTISSAKSARLSGKDLEKIADFNIKESEKLNTALAPILANLKKGMKFALGVQEVYDPLMKKLSEFVSPEPIVGSIEPQANFLLRELNEIIETEQEKEKPSISPLSRWKDRRFEKDDVGNYRLSCRIANKKLLSLANVMQNYERELEQSGLYDFADMIEQAIKIIKEDKGFRLTLSERYQYILLDEFQDTNAAQAELIYSLTDYEKPCVMAVGDDDQAIFAFQGANVSNLLNFEEHYHAKVITLVENYRSHSEILTLSYMVREQIGDSFAKSQKIDKTLFSKKAVGAKISRHEFLEASAEYHWVAEKIHELIQSGAKKSDIAIITPKHKYITPLLPYLKSYGDISIAYEKRDNLFEDARIHELLTLSQFVYELSQGKNPAHLLFEIISFPFFEVPPLDAVRALSRDRHKPAIDYLTESDSEKQHNIGVFLATLATKSTTSSLEHFLDMLIGTAEYSEGQRSNFLEYYTGGASSDSAPNSDSKKSDPYSAFELYENLSVLREAIIKHPASKKSMSAAKKNTPSPSPTLSSSTSLKDLIDFVSDYQLAEAPLVNTSPYQDSADSVQILTAHKAKGLEFEYVFLIATDDRAWGNAKGNNNMLSLPQNLISIRHTGVTEDERLRLFFVAITRAKTHLYLTNSVKDFSGKSPARLQYLDEAELPADTAADINAGIEPDIDSIKITPDATTEKASNTETAVPNTETAVLSPFLPEGSRLINLHYENLPSDKLKSDLTTHWVANYQRPSGELRSILEKRLENYRMSATDLTTFVDIVYAGPQTFYQQKILRAPEESYSESLTFGNLIHATFEHVTSDKLDTAAALEFYQNELNVAPVPEEDREDMLERGRGTIKATLAAFGDLLRADTARAEVNLAHERLIIPIKSSANRAKSTGPANPTNSTSSASLTSSAAAGIPLTGKLDHIQIDQKSKTIEVYDYKTSAYHKEKWDSHPTLFKYKLQLCFYKLLLSLSPEYSKYKVEKAHILFVVPDSKDGKVYDKIYEYNDADDKQLRSLIRAVYQQIQGLRFLDDAEIFIPPDADKNLREIKDFIALLLEKSKQK